MTHNHYLEVFPEVPMNKFYKILVMFQRGEKITRSRLLQLNGVTTELLDSCIEQGLLMEIDKTDFGEIRYIITEKGISIRDN